jgi:hypothetical protein
LSPLRAPIEWSDPMPELVILFVVWLFVLGRWLLRGDGWS